MDMGWKRVPMLLILLIFWEHAFGQKGWSSHDVPPRQKWHDHKIPSPRGVQSSVLEAPGSIPFEEVASNVLAGKRSRFSLSRQYVKGGISSSIASMSPTQGVSASLALPQKKDRLYSNPSLLQLQGSFSPSIQDISSQSGVQLGETSSPLSAQSSSSTGSSASSLSEFTYTSQGRSGPQLAGSSGPLVSTDTSSVTGSGMLPQSQSTASQNIPGSSVYTKLVASPPSVTQSTSGQSSYSQYTSGSQRRVGPKLAASPQYVPTLESSYGSSFQPQGTTSQYAPTFSFGAKGPVSSQYYPATLSGSSQSLSQSLKWQPSTSRTNVFQPSSTAVLQGFQTSGVSQSISQYPSRFVSLSSASADGSSLQLQGTSSQTNSAFLDAKVPVYSQAAPSEFSLSMSQSSHLKPSTSRWSQGFQAPGTVTSQSSSPSQGSKSPSRFSTLTSAAIPGQSFSNVYTSSSPSRAGAPLAASSHYVPMQTGSTSTDGSSLQLQGTSGQYTPAALVAKVPPYKPAAPSGSVSLSQPSQWQPSTSRWSQGFEASGTVASQSNTPSQGSKSPSRLSTLTSAASPGKLFSTQDGSGRYSGLFIQSQSASSQYAPAALDAKVPVYSQAAPSGLSLNMSQPSQWQPSTSRWSQGFQASGTVASQSSSPSQGSKSPSRLSTLTSAASPGKLFSTQDGSGRYSGLFIQSQSASSQYAPAALDAKVPVYSQAAPSGLSLNMSQPSQWQPSTSRWSQGFQASGTVASQSSSPSQGSKSPSRLSTLTSAASPGKLFSTQDGSGRYSGLFIQSQSASSQYAPAALDAKVPVYSQAAPSGLSLNMSQPSQWQPSTSRWSQGFQASGTVASQSSSPSQGSKSPSRLSTLTSAESPGEVFSTQDGSGRYSGLSSQSQSASSQYNHGSPANVKHGFSFLDSSRQSTSDQSSSPQFSSGSSFMAALSHPVDSVAQSSISNSWRTSSLSGVGLRPSMLSSKASGSVIRRQMSTGLFGSVQHPTDSTTYGQKPSQSSSTSERYFSSVKG